MYDLNELEAFVSVVKSGSLTASARELNLPKSTLKPIMSKSLWSIDSM